MAKEKDELMQQQAAEQPVTEDRPNRTAYAAMFAEDNPDVDFEDKEARYGRMAEERKSYRDLSNAGRKLSANLAKKRWVGAMIQDLFADEKNELDPITWLYRNGIDVQKAMEDEAYRKGCVEGLQTWLSNQEAGEESAKEMDNNLQASVDALDAVSQELGISPEQCNRMWNHLFEDVIAPGMKGEVSKETWEMVLHAMNYDTDIKNAREEAGMQARNEKIQNKVKSFEESQVPPSFTQGQGRVAPSRTKKEESLTDFVKRYS